MVRPITLEFDEFGRYGLPDDVRAVADKFKTRMCKAYQQSTKCPYYDRCMFAHGQRELRTVEDNIDAGLVSMEAIKEYQKAKRENRVAQDGTVLSDANAAPAGYVVLQPVLCDSQSDASETSSQHSDLSGSMESGSRYVVAPYYSAVPSTMSVGSFADDGSCKRRRGGKKSGTK